MRKTIEKHGEYSSLEVDGNARPGYALHHVYEDIPIERYIQWNMDDIVMINEYEYMKIQRRKDLEEVK